MRSLEPKNIILKLTPFSFFIFWVQIYTNSKDTSSALESSIDTVQFGYCREDRRWIMYEGNMTDPCLAGEAKLAQSIKTQSFDISTSYGDTWTSVSGSPLDLYVFNIHTISIVIPVLVYGDSQVFLFMLYCNIHYSFIIATSLT